jgi:hypothetical protein
MRALQQPSIGLRMTIQIKILNIDRAALLNRLGSAATSHWLQEMPKAAQCYMAELNSRAGTGLLGWGYGGSPLSTGDFMPYDDWLRDQSRRPRLRGKPAVSQGLECTSPGGARTRGLDAAT